MLLNLSGVFIKKTCHRVADVFYNTNLIVALIVIFPLMLIWQGLDFTDTGYLLTNYQQIFNEPASVESSFRIWLTNVLGGVWLYFFGSSLGLIGFRLAGVLVTYLTSYCAYLILKPYFEKRFILWALLVALIFINRSMFVFNYNSLTALFYVLSAYFLIKGLRDNQLCQIGISGFILGLNIFIRLPNLLGFLFLIPVLLHGYLYKSTVSLQIKQVIRFLTGYLLSILLALLTMYLIGHLGGYVSAVKDTFLMLNDPSGHHGSNKLIYILIDNNKWVLYRLKLILFASMALLLILTICSKFSLVKFQTGIIVLTGFTLIHWCWDYYRYWFDIIAALLGLLYFILFLSILILPKERKELRLISFIALLILVLVPLGSNNGIRNSVYGMYLSIPLAFCYITTVSSSTINKITGRLMKVSPVVNECQLSFLKVILIVVLFLLSVRSTYYFTYRDANERLNMSHSINHYLLKGVMTTYDRAQVVEELLAVLPQYVKQDDYLLAYEQISLIHFLTNTKPYLFSSWPMLYSPHQFEKSLDRALNEIPGLPFIVRAKGNTEDLEWPHERGLRKDSSSFEAIRTIMNDFIDQRNYQKVWENSFFEILAPKG